MTAAVRMRRSGSSTPRTKRRSVLRYCWTSGQHHPRKRPSMTSRRWSHPVHRPEDRRGCVGAALRTRARASNPPNAPPERPSVAALHPRPALNASASRSSVKPSQSLSTPSPHCSRLPGSGRLGVIAVLAGRDAVPVDIFRGIGGLVVIVIVIVTSTVTAVRRAALPVGSMRSWSSPSPSGSEAPEDGGIGVPVIAGGVPLRAVAIESGPVAVVAVLVDAVVPEARGRRGWRLGRDHRSRRRRGRTRRRRGPVRGDGPPKLPMSAREPSGSLRARSPAST